METFLRPRYIQLHNSHPLRHVRNPKYHYLIHKISNCCSPSRNSIVGNHQCTTAHNKFTSRQMGTQTAVTCEALHTDIRSSGTSRSANVQLATDVSLQHTSPIFSYTAENGTLCCAVTSVANCQAALRNVLEERISHTMMEARNLSFIQNSLPLIRYAHQTSTLM